MINESNFKRSVIATLIAVYLLILAGALVRVTGSGMGCPDWPKCYGQWVPPTSADQLPEGYKEHYIEKRHNKNLKLSGMLQKMGMDSLANKIANDPAIYQELDFNARKTWTEYINRLIGALTGVIAFVMMIFSFVYRKTNKPIVWLSILTVVIIGIEGWIGSVVVSTKLLQNVVTVHMLLALVVVYLLIYISAKVKNEGYRSDVSGKFFKPLSMLLLLMLGIEVLMGSQVRESLERLASEGAFAENRIGMLGNNFLIHRSFTWAILGLSIILFEMARRKGMGSNAGRITLLLLISFLFQMITGFMMNYFAIPAFAQAAHLLIGSLSFGLVCHLNIQLNLRPAKVK